MLLAVCGTKNVIHIKKKLKGKVGVEDNMKNSTTRTRYNTKNLITKKTLKIIKKEIKRRKK